VLVLVGVAGLGVSFVVVVVEASIDTGFFGSWPSSLVHGQHYYVYMQTARDLYKLNWQELRVGSYPLLVGGAI
jgi:hypothetical protein